MRMGWGELGSHTLKQPKDVSLLSKDTSTLKTNQGVTASRFQKGWWRWVRGGWGICEKMMTRAGKISREGGPCVTSKDRNHSNCPNHRTMHWYGRHAIMRVGGFALRLEQHKASTLWTSELACLDRGYTFTGL